MVDMAHFAGLVAGGVFTDEYNPIPHADVAAFAKQRVEALLSRFPVYPQLDLEYLETTFASVRDVVDLKKYEKVP